MLKTASWLHQEVSDLLKVFEIQDKHVMDVGKTF